MAMKKMLLILLAVATAGQIFAAGAEKTAEEIWVQANEAYTQGDYAKGVQGYESIRRMGFAGAKVYYNLGNAYYKMNRVGPAILNYNKALRLAPADGDVRHNLAVAGASVKDRIDVVPEFFLKTWLRSLMRRAGSNAWAAWSLVFLAAGLALALVYLLASRLGWRKAGFYGGAVCIALFIVSLVFSSVERREILYPDEAVIMLAAAPVKSSPDNNSKDIFVLHEGTKVRVTGALGDWREIVVADGNKGWILSRSLETI